MVNFDPGKHRRPERETLVPAGMPFSTAELPQTPVDVAGAAIGESGRRASEYDRMPIRREMAGAALRAANQRPALPDPDWPPSRAGYRAQWDGPPSLHPDHPSAPVPRVRADAAASREAAHLRAVILSLSAQLGQMSDYLTENFASAAGPAAFVAATPKALPAAPGTRPARPASRPTRPAARPTRPIDRPTRPASRHARPGTKLTTRPATGTRGRRSHGARKMVGLIAALVTPADKQQRRGRQQQAMRFATAVTAVSFLFAVGTGVTELALHGFPFFVFRQGGTGETGAPETDQQFLAAEAAAAKAAAKKHAVAKPPAHKPHTPGRHSARKISAL
jgi:hypothetical protein